MHKLFFAALVAHSIAFAADAPKVVEVVTLKPMTIAQEVKLIGVIKAKKESHIRSSIAGVIEQISVQDGAHVKARSQLARLDDDELKHTLFHAQENAKTSKAQFKRIEKLFEQHDVSKQILEEAKSKWISAQIAVDEAKRALNKTIFLAPFDGTCGVFRVSEGAQVNPGDEIVAFYDPRELVMEFSIPEKLINQITVGQDVVVSEAHGEIVSVQRAIDPRTHMGLARASIPKCPTCIIGSHTDVRVIVDERLHVLGVPNEAVFIRDGKRHVYTVKSSKAHLRPVEIGLVAGNITQVTKGLQAGDVVIIRGQNRLQDQTAIKVAP